ncbi:MAG: ion channel [Fluviibacter phosphoraccumulans]
MHSFLTWILNGALIAIAVFIHYETLYSLARHLPNLSNVPPRYRVLLGVFVILIAHAVEIWVFALGCYSMIQLGLGNLFGMTTPDLLSDCVYLSWISFTTVGFGDVAANGDLRFLPGLEALTGFVLITWSASFLFIEMQKFWPMNKQVAHHPDSRDH